MGLSNDPEKRERQMANLRAGWAKNAQRLQEPSPPKPSSDVEVFDRGPKPQAKPKPRKPPAKKPASPKARRPPRAETSREPRGGSPPSSSHGGGFLDGFFGR